MKQGRTPIGPNFAISKESKKFSKRKKLNIYLQLNEIQKVELTNLHSPAKIRAFLQKHHPLVELLSNQGEYYQNSLINLYPSNIKRILKNQEETEEIIPYSEKEVSAKNTYHILNIGQQFLFEKIKSIHHENLETLGRNFQLQNELMARMHLKITKCDIKSHFGIIHSKRRRKAIKHKKVFNECIENESPFDKMAKENTESSSKGEVLLSNDEELQFVNNKKHEKMLCSDDFSEITEKCSFQMFQNSDKQPFIPISFKEELIFDM